MPDVKGGDVRITMQTRPERCGAVAKRVAAAYEQMTADWLDDGRMHD